MAKQIRLWKLGSLDHRITPAKETVDKLRDILAKAKEEDGVVDLVWGPELTVEVYDVSDDVTEIVVQDPATVHEISIRVK